MDRRTFLAAMAALPALMRSKPEPEKAFAGDWTWADQRAQKLEQIHLEAQYVFLFGTVPVASSPPPYRSNATPPDESSSGQAE